MNNFKFITSAKDLMRPLRCVCLSVSLSVC